MNCLTASGAVGLYAGPINQARDLSPLPDATHQLEPADQRRASWMGLAQAGDRRAYEKVLAEAVPIIRVIARRQGVPIDAVDDVVQETLLTIHRVRHTYDPARSFDAWLTAIAQRRAIDALRGLGRRDRREVHDDYSVDVHPDEHDAAHDAEREQEGLRLRDAIATLPPGQREAVEQLGLRERSLAEASHETGRTTGALKVNLHRALKALRDRIQGES